MPKPAPGTVRRPARPRVPKTTPDDANLSGHLTPSQAPANLPGTAAFDRELKRVQSGTAAARLHNLRTIYMARGLTAGGLARLTGLDPARVAALANLTAIEEPWLDEAWTIARALGTAGIVPLIGSPSGNLTDCPMGLALDTDMDAFRAGLRMPLSLACRVAVRLGLDDPAQLVIDPLTQQIWDVVEANERRSAPGGCPWCCHVAAEGHADWCLPALLWGARDRDGSARAALGGYAPRPVGAKRQARASAIGHGLLALRLRLYKRQEDMANVVGVSVNHYARLERGAAPLAQKHAERLAAAFRVDVATLYAAPEAGA